MNTVVLPPPTLQRSTTIINPNLLARAVRNGRANAADKIVKYQILAFKSLDDSLLSNYTHFFSGAVDNFRITQVKAESECRLTRFSCPHRTSEFLCCRISLANHLIQQQRTPDHLHENRGNEYL